MARSTYFDRSRIADACPGSESGYAQRFQCGNIVKRLIWTRMMQSTEVEFVVFPKVINEVSINITVILPCFLRWQPSP